MKLTMTVSARAGGVLALYRDGEPVEFTLNGVKSGRHDLGLDYREGHVRGYLALMAGADYLIALADRWAGAKNATVELVVPELVANQVNGDWKASALELAYLLLKVMEKIGVLSRKYADVQIKSARPIKFE